MSATRRPSGPLEKRILKACKKQGWTVVETKSGWMLRSLDGTTQVAMHVTPSDHRAALNLVRQLRRAGLDF